MREHGQTMHYVYLLRSIRNPDQCYISETTDLKKRLAEHNAGLSIHTNKFRPWEIEVYLGFKDKVKAIEFETYLKHGSGHAFRKKHFWSKI